MNKIRLNHLLCLPLVAATLAAADAADKPVDFDRQIAPLLASRCLECHSGPSPKGKLDLSDRDRSLRGGETGPALVPRRAADSLVWVRIMQDDMPPKHPLPKTERALLHRWISEGARWGTNPIDRFRYTTESRAGYNWWSLLPLAPPAPPAITAETKRHSRWPRNNIDRFVLARLVRQGLSPAPAASPRALIRRLFVDLHGLPPDPGTVAAFVANPSETAYETLVDRLLASPHYGERWGRHWLDVVRFGESNGFERNAPRTTFWHYRDWVIQALNQDMPYDRFAQLQLAGDLILPGVEGAAAAGFLVAGVHNTVVGGSKRMKLLARQDELEELAGTVGQTFLGLTINCGRCHDHKFDPIPSSEYYRVVAALDGVAHGERDVAQPEQAARQAIVDTKIRSLQQRLTLLEKRARASVLKTRKKKAPTKTPSPDLPRPTASWNFDSDFRDSIGSLHGRPVGGARLEKGAVVVDGKTAYVQTAKLTKPLAEKTLEAWVQLANLTQRGGGVISIQASGGGVFDAIVYGEREPGHWMAGSNGFVRTRSFAGSVETMATTKPVHFAISYQADGTITGYRNGRLYGKAYRTGFQKYSAGNAEIVFGLRHAPAGGNKMLSARILQARLYDRALSPKAIAASAGAESEFVSARSLLAAMTANERTQHAVLGKQLTTLETESRKLATLARAKLYTVTPRQPEKMRIHIRGSVTNYGPTVTPGGISAVPGLPADFGLAADAPDSSRRRKLAAWITSPQNPLFTRVMVNRVWHYHFGRGIVSTPSDFGFNGARPSHPRLLEWLAARFTADGFRIKSLHRTILLSATYRQASRPRPLPLARDANNRLLWRMSPRRIEAEVLRDSILAVAGQLDITRGGPGFVDVSITPNNGTTYYEPFDKNDAALNRRTIYRFTPRGGRSAVLDTFDCPDPSIAAPRRNVTTTPLQALSLLNNAFVLRMAAYFATRIADDVGDDIDRQITRGWQLAVQHDPDPRQRRLSRKLIRNHGLPTLCRALFNTNDFIIIE
ncbi:MAG: DUF1553 domain-containing protein [Planctomycetaceae bacterium]|nr:DUF1553 domain-containing protein [Planctomycetaceae bacterium]